MNTPVLVWFRLDLRLTDNPALAAAAARSRHVLPVFIWAPEEDTSDYPLPIVDHVHARARALKALAAIRQR